MPPDAARACEVAKMHARQPKCMPPDAHTGQLGSQHPCQAAKVHASVYHTGLLGSQNACQATKMHASRCHTGLLDRQSASWAAKNAYQNACWAANTPTGEIAAEPNIDRTLDKSPGQANASESSRP